MSIKNKYIGILLIATTMLLSACSSDNPEAQTVTTVNEPVGKEVQLMSYASPFTDQELSHRAAPAGFTAYTTDKTTNMGVYMLLENSATDWASPEEGRITYNPSTGKWNAYFEVEKNKTFTVYGYMPKTGEMGSTLAKSTADAATLTITGIKPVTTDDICIITGVKDTDDGLKEGQFSWSTPMEEVETYKISMLMDHIYAGVQLRMTIDKEYAQLRTIKLKKLTLNTNKESFTAEISLTHNDTGASPISSITYTSSGSSSTSDIYKNDEGTALDKTTPLSVNAYFAPGLSSNLTLVSTYDVYDSKDNLIRQNCTATNKLPNLEAIRGQRVLLNMTVNPTYLYVLSDPDLDNPTITIGN